MVESSSEHLIETFNYRVRQKCLPLPASAHISSLHGNGIKELRSLALIWFSDHLQGVSPLEMLFFENSLKIEKVQIKL